MIVDLDALVCKEVMWMLIERYGYDFVYAMMVEVGTDELPEFLDAIEEMRKDMEDPDQ
jgi:hypothetical protein